MDAEKEWPEPGPAANEAELQRQWAALAAGAGPLRTTEGELLRVLFPGVHNRGAGPDFCGAVIATERGRVVRGDVEVHPEPGGWRAHGHHADPRYAGVVLHVVGRAGDAGPTGLPGGGRAPVLELPAGGDDASEGLHPCTACAAAIEPEVLLARLTELGTARLRARAALWRRRLERQPADALLWAACLDQLATGTNRAVLRLLAQRLPWNEVQGVRAAQSLLLGAAGWLEGPPVLPAPLHAECRGLWEAAGAPRVVERSAWSLGACRPAAHPARRLLGAGVWLDRWRAVGLASQLARPEAAELKAVALAAHFAVSAADAQVGGTAPVGGGRAAAMVVNAALPFLLAAALQSGDAAHAAAVLECYGQHPALEADRVVRPLVTALGLAERRLTACQQQGLHHLFRRSCARGRQGRCLLMGGGTVTL